MTYNLFIGSNNQTKMLEIEKIREILDERHEGYTITRTQGAWHKERENSCTVLLQVEHKGQAVMTAQILRKALQQDAVGLQAVPELEFVS